MLKEQKSRVFRTNPKKNRNQKIFVFLILACIAIFLAAILIISLSKSTQKKKWIQPEVSAFEGEAHGDPVIDYLCLAIIRNDPSLCDNIRPYDETETRGCKRDVTFFHLDKYACSDIQDEELRQICTAIRENNPKECKGNFLNTVCHAIINNDVSICNQLDTQIQLFECRNIYIIGTMNSKEDCKKLSPVPGGPLPIDWSIICEGRWTKNESVCAP